MTMFRETPASLAISSTDRPLASIARFNVSLIESATGGEWGWAGGNSSSTWRRICSSLAASSAVRLPDRITRLIFSLPIAGHVLDGQSVLGDVLDVTIRVILVVPNDLEEVPCLLSESCNPDNRMILNRETEARARRFYFVGSLVQEGDILKPFQLHYCAVEVGGKWHGDGESSTWGRKLTAPTGEDRCLFQRCASQRVRRSPRPSPRGTSHLIHYGI